MDAPSSLDRLEPGGAAACDKPQGTPPGWARWVARISLVIALGAMGATIWAVGPATLVGHLRAIGWWFAGILALEVVITAFDARALYVLACDREQQGFGQVLFAQIAGRGVNAVTPAGALGEATKVSLLTRGMSTERAVASVLFLNMMSGILQLSAVAVGAPLTALLLPLPSPLKIALVVTGVIAAVIAAGLFVLVRRGMLASLVGAAVKLRIVSKKRREKWHKKLSDIDERLCGARDAHGRKMATIYIACSKAVSWASVWITLGAAGYWAGPGMIAALVSAGVVMGWVATVVPLGLGVSETGNYAMFTALGVTPAYGVALALARRINQIFYAAIGFTLLATWRASSRAAAKLRGRRTTRGGAHVRSPAPVGNAE